MLADEYDGMPIKIEDNIRFGDPEAQVVIPQIKMAGVDLYGDLIEPAAHGRLGDISWDEAAVDAMVTICVAAEGYAERDEIPAGDIITGLERASEFEGDVKVYHGGTERLQDGRLATAGGRVIYLTGKGKTILDARANVLRAYDGGVGNFRGNQLRRDIAWQMESAA
jgi:phosphoribosylamine--glycine ligase